MNILSKMVRSDIFRRRPYALQIVLIAITLTVFASCFCSRKSARTEPYRIMRGSGWDNFYLHGMEKQVQGLSDDLLFEISRVEKLRIQIDSYEGIAPLSLLDKKYIDGVLSSIAPTPQNMKDYLFSDPYFAEGPVIVTRSGEEAASLNALQGRLVGVERGYLWALEQSGSNTAVFQAYDNIGQMIEDLLNEKIDAMIIDSVVAMQLARGLYIKKIQVSSSPLQVIGIRLVVKRGKSEELINDFNQGLILLKEKGTYQRMLRYWGLFDVFEPSTIQERNH